MTLLLVWILNSVALLAVAYLLPGIVVASFGSAMFAALILGLVNMLVRPVLVLLTLPITQFQAVLGKFLAAWAFCAIALAMTFPFVLTVNVLGRPDNGVIVTGYLGALLVAGGFLAMGSAMSALTKNQVIAFVLAVSLCFVFALAASPVLGDFLRQSVPQVADVLRRVGVLERYQDFTRGVITLPDCVYFLSLIGFWLFTTAVIVDLRKAD